MIIRISRACLKRRLVKIVLLTMILFQKFQRQLKVRRSKLCCFTRDSGWKQLRMLKAKRFGGTDGVQDVFFKWDQGLTYPLSLLFDV